MKLSEFGGLERIQSIWCVLEWSLFLLYWMRCLEWLDGYEWGGWGVFIAPNHFNSRYGGCWRWAHQTVWCATGQALFLVRCAATLPNHLGFGAQSNVGALSSCGTEQSGATPDSPVPHWLPALTSVVILFICQSRPLRADSSCYTGSPDSPVAHRTVRWIIAERAFVYTG
jgi:hypothetical protein